MADVAVVDKPLATPAADDYVMTIVDGVLTRSTVSETAAAGIAVSDVPGDIDALQAADTALDGRLDTAESTLTSHGSRLTTAESDIDALQAADTALDGRLDTAEADIVALESATAFSGMSGSTALASVIGLTGTGATDKRALPNLATDLLAISSVQAAIGAAATVTTTGTGAAAASVQTLLTHCINVRNFGILGDDSNEYSKILLAWNEAISSGRNLYFPKGTYNCGTNNFPFKNPTYPSSELYDGKNITIFGDGPDTILKTASVNGADVLNLYQIKNLHIRDVAITATVSGSDAGSNGISVIAGFDNITIRDVLIYNLGYIDKTTYLDGGKALTIQTGTPSTEVGTLVARGIKAVGCVYGFGAELDLANQTTKRTAIDIEVVAENCRIGAAFSAGEASSTLAASFSIGLKVDLLAINCQRSVQLARAHGLVLNAVVVTNKSKAARRLDYTGSKDWNSDTTVEALLCTYAHDSRIDIRGMLNDCDYKARIGGASAGSSGRTGKTSNSIITLDIGGTAATADVLAMDNGGNVMEKSTLIASHRTATTIPAAFYAIGDENTIVVGASSKLPELNLSGPLYFAYTDGKTPYNYIRQEDLSLTIRQYGASSVAHHVVVIKNHSNVAVSAIRNDGSLALSDVQSATAVSDLVSVIPVYNLAGTRVGWVPLYTNKT